MKIRQASVDELRELWEYSGSHTYNYFVDGMKQRHIEFWCVYDQEIVGELYIFFDSEDKDEANGVDRAYLCALRIRHDYQGKGLSTRLVQAVLTRLKERGYKEVTIGIDNDHYEKLKSMYHKWGFDKLVKKTSVDYHCFDKFGKIIEYDDLTELYLKTIE